mgnify:CR=1 FL=1
MKHLLFIFLFCSVCVQAQFRITGIIKDQTNQKPLPFVTIETNTGIVSTSDVTGKFEISSNSTLNSLIFSYIGYENTTVNASSGMRVVMKEQANQLQDVVVIGYGTRKKVDNTSVITSLKAEDVTKTKVLNASQAIEFRRPLKSSPKIENLLSDFRKVIPFIKTRYRLIRFVKIRALI